MSTDPKTADPAPAASEPAVFSVAVASPPVEAAELKPVLEREQTSLIASEPPAPSPATTPTAETAPVPTPVEKDTADVVEPENALTKQFTEAEWKALKDFRVRY